MMQLYTQIPQQKRADVTADSGNFYEAPQVESIHS